LLEKLYVFVSGSYAHSVWTKIQKEQFPNQSIRELKQLSDTRWSCQEAACRSIKERFSCVIGLLQLLSEENNTQRAIEAKGILLQLNINFVFCLHVFCDLLREAKGASDSLQKVAIDLSISADLIQTCQSTLVAYRNEDKCSQYYDSAKSVCEMYDLPLELSFCGSRGRSSNLMRLSSALKDSVVTEPICRRSCLQPNPDSFRKELYYPILDSMIGEFSRRFSGDSINMLRAIGTLVPSGDEFLDFQKLELLANQYKCNLADLQLEIKQMKRMISRKTSENSMPSAFLTLFDFVSFLWPYRDELNLLRTESSLSRIALSNLVFHWTD
jgi:hypothetical protein